MPKATGRQNIWKRRNVSLASEGHHQDCSKPFMGLGWGWVACKRMILDQVCTSPVFTTGLFVSRGLVAGQGPGEIWKKMKEQFLNVMLTGAIVWPAAQFLNFLLVPLPYRVLFNNCVGLCWSTFTSVLASYEGSSNNTWPEDPGRKRFLHRWSMEPMEWWIHFPKRRQQGRTVNNRVDVDTHLCVMMVSPGFVDETQPDILFFGCTVEGFVFETSPPPLRELLVWTFGVDRSHRPFTTLYSFMGNINCHRVVKAKHFLFCY